MARLLGLQDSLQLVFLNACTTGPQVSCLQSLGVDAVIATARPIADVAAREFATAFYTQLAAGKTFKDAFELAGAKLRTGRGGSVRDFLADDAAVTTEDISDKQGFPWSLHIRQGAEKVEQESLPRLAGNPLLGLPSLPPCACLPPSPYRHLQRFTRDEAHIFFGRGQEIADLFNLVTSPLSRPVILYSGPTGVGKSSILDAGLRPRLEATHDCLYIRRNAAAGLAGTLARELSAGATERQADLGRLWLDREKTTGKPLVIALDQAEEAFTRRRGPSPEAEVAELVSGVKTAFTEPGQSPGGRLIVSFRKEWLQDFERAHDEARLGYARMLVAPLGRSGLIEVITGPVRDDDLRAFYGLCIDRALPEKIAVHLESDAGSALAPTLQVLLTKLWTSAGGKGGTFTDALYENLKKQGFLLKDVLEEAGAELFRWQEEVVESGFALDVLEYHTTPLGTAESRSRAELIARYPHRALLLDEFLRVCERSYLLIPGERGARTEFPPDESSPAPAAREPAPSRLGHDTLAPLVRDRYRSSMKPGQRARRLLENRVSEWEDGNDGNVFDAADLGSVEGGLMGMREWTSDEKRLVEASRAAESRRIGAEKERQRQLDEAKAREETARADQQRETELRLREQEEAGRMQARANTRLRARGTALKWGLAVTTGVFLLALYQWRVAVSNTRIAKQETRIAEQNLADGILRAIGGTPSLSNLERQQFFDLAAQNSRIRRDTLEQGFASPESAARLWRRADYMAKAVVGLDETMRRQVVTEVILPRLSSPGQPWKIRLVAARLGFLLRADQLDPNFLNDAWPAAFDGLAKIQSDGSSDGYALNAFNLEMDSILRDLDANQGYRAAGMIIKIIPEPSPRRTYDELMYLSSFLKAAVSKLGSVQADDVAALLINALKRRSLGDYPAVRSAMFMPLAGKVSDRGCAELADVVFDTNDVVVALALHRDSRAAALVIDKLISRAASPDRMDIGDEATTEYVFKQVTERLDSKVGSTRASEIADRLAQAITGASDSRNHALLAKCLNIVSRKLSDDRARTLAVSTSAHLENLIQTQLPEPAPEHESAQSTKKDERRKRLRRYNSAEMSAAERFYMLCDAFIFSSESADRLDRDETSARVIHMIIERMLSRSYFESARHAPPDILERLLARSRAAHADPRLAELATRMFNYCIRSQMRERQEWRSCLLQVLGSLDAARAEAFASSALEAIRRYSGDSPQKKVVSGPGELDDNLKSDSDFELVISAIFALLPRLEAASARTIADGAIAVVESKQKKASNGEWSATYSRYVITLCLLSNQSERAHRLAVEEMTREIDSAYRARVGVFSSEDLTLDSRINELAKQLTPDELLGMADSFIEKSRSTTDASTYRGLLRGFGGLARALKQPAAGEKSSRMLARLMPALLAGSIDDKNLVAAATPVIQALEQSQLLDLANQIVKAFLDPSLSSNEPKIAKFDELLKLCLKRLEPDSLQSAAVTIESAIRSAGDPERLHSLVSNFAMAVGPSQAGLAADVIRRCRELGQTQNYDSINSSIALLLDVMSPVVAGPELERELLKLLVQPDCVMALERSVLRRLSIIAGQDFHDNIWLTARHAPYMQSLIRFEADLRHQTSVAR